MNILIITPGFHPVPAFEGGAIESLVQSYLESNKLNNITVYSIKPIEEYNNSITKYESVEFRYISLEKFDRYNYIKKIKKDIIKKGEIDKFDVVIVENISLYCIYLRKLFNGRIILHLHNDYLNKNTKLAKLKYKCCDEVWCVSEFIANRVNEINLKKKKAKVLYNGIDIYKFNRNNLDINKLLELRGKYSIPQNAKIFLYAGRIMKEKGILELIKAFNILQRDNNNVYLLIVGGDKSNGNMQDSYIRTIKEESNNNNIIFAGNIDSENMPYYYGISNYQIVPSLWNEAFGLVIVEGMACGLPVIATKVGGIPELVNSFNGILVNKENIENELVDAMKKMLTTSIEQYSQQAVETAKRFENKNYTNKIEELLIEFIDKKNKITLFSEYTKTDLNAGPKAKTDVEKIVQNKYNTNIVFINYKLYKNKILNVMYKIKKAIKIIVNSKKDRIAVIQFPFVQRGYSLFKNYKKVVVLVHDIEGLRRKDERLLKKEIDFFNKCDYLILHNEKMKEELINKGLENKKIIVLEVFDYLCPNNEIEKNDFNTQPTIVYAGNLRKEKSPFIYQLQNEKVNFYINLYGIGLQKDISEKIKYKGSFLPDELPSKLQGNLGLVWDGNYDESDENEGFKNYTKYNNPHKLSCYIAAGLPVIVWEKSAISEFVRQYDIGYTINNIYDINEINFNDYYIKKQNIENLRNNVIKGYYTIRAVDSVINKMEE